MKQAVKEIEQNRPLHTKNVETVKTDNLEKAPKESLSTSLPLSRFLEANCDCV